MIENFTENFGWIEIALFYGIESFDVGTVQLVPG